MTYYYVKVTSSYHVAPRRIHEVLGAFFNTYIAVFNGEQGKESINRVRMG